jgi:aldehyde dehydrogenase (NAD+)
MSSELTEFLQHINASGLDIFSPVTGQRLTSVAVDNSATLASKIASAKTAQARFAQTTWQVRNDVITAYHSSLKAYREMLAQLVTLDAGKTPKEALAEVDGSADILLKTIADASLPELGGMVRRKERPPVGIIGLITSFNFPLAVAHWNIAPALLAGNAVLWKPSEKTLLAAIYAKQCFDAVAEEYKDILQLAIGSREVGELLVADEAVDMISATGSVAMGQGIKRALANKKNNTVPPILELGGNNAALIGNAMTEAHLRWSLDAIITSFLGTTGQRCTNTRRLIVPAEWLAPAVDYLREKLQAFITSGTIDDENNVFGYSVLIDADAYARFESAKTQAVAEGGEIFLGEKLPSAENVYRVQPALALMTSHGPSLHHETFAPMLYIVPYEGDVAAGIALVNAPENAGLVNAVYTLSQQEADDFVRLNEAGHTVINSPKGTGTPANGMGFGGNKASGEGEILNAADPLAAFTRRGNVKRVAQFKDIPLAE